MHQKKTLFLAASAVVILASLNGCKEDGTTTPKDPNKKFSSAEECAAYYGHTCVPEVAPRRLTATTTPLFTTRQACEAQYGLENCLSTTVKNGRTRPADLPEERDVDLSDSNWMERIEDAPAVTALDDTTTLYYPYRRSREDGSSYYYPGSGYYSGSPRATFHPVIIVGGGGGYTPPYVVGNSGRVAMRMAQSPSAGPPHTVVGGGSSSAKVSAPSAAPSAPASAPSSGISGGASGKSGGFGGTGSSAS